MVLSLSALAIGVLISVPLGIFVSRKPSWQGAVLGTASLIQTIPSIALLALMVLAMGGQIGFWPSFLALMLYSVLPVLRNTVVGISELEPEYIEAARGVGMTEKQRLFQVELPLALPVIVAGIRTSAVWVVGIATLSTPVGAASLGNYIFAGLQTRNWLSVVFGCVLAAALAIVLDQLIRAIEWSIQQRKPLVGRIAGAGLASIFVIGLAPPLWGALSSNFAMDAAVGAKTTTEVDERIVSGALPLKDVRIKIGAKTFTEQYILADVFEKHLRAQGAEVENLQNMGSTILFDALRQNSVDLYVDYTGTIWTTLMKKSEPVSRAEMFIQVADFLLREHKVVVAGRLGFENAYGLAMRRDKAAELGVTRIGDLANLRSAISIGGDPEFFARPEWIAVREAYGISEARTTSMDSTFMYGAVRDGEVDAITAYTTDGRISAFDLLVLQDPRQAFPPYDAIILIGPAASQRLGFVGALTPLVNQISDQVMRQANQMVDIDGESTGTAADFILAEIAK